MRRAILILSAISAMATMNAASLKTNKLQMENLNRGMVVVPTSQGNFISWRFLGTDNNDTSFDLYYNGNRIKTFGLNSPTSYLHSGVSTSAEYKLVALQDGIPTDSTTATKWGNRVMKLKLDRPQGGTNKSGSYSYVPNDCSVGDVDGDGEYEIIVKWDPTNSQDNSNDGYTGNVYLDCYKLNGTKLWRIDLGVNIRAGAHYTQFLVFDFDKDGKAEMICKTAPGSKDGAGNYVCLAADEDEIRNVDNTKDHRNSSGYVLAGAEYLTVFNGETGKAVHTVFYNPNRAGEIGGAPSGSNKSYWGDDYGNRCDRYLATVAYIDGAEALPCAIMCRGYYTRAFLWAVKYEGGKLRTKWLHHASSETIYQLTDSTGTKKNYSRLRVPNTSGENTSSHTAYGQGAHAVEAGDVDGDGCDEIIYGSAAIDHDGNQIYSTGLGHGDALHLADMDPDRPGLEVFMPHEDGKFGDDMHDAATGEILVRGFTSDDNGRGIAADISTKYRGYEMWSGVSYLRNCKGDNVTTNRPSKNFRVYWDGDVSDELLDGTSITKWNSSNNGTTTLVNFGSSTWNNAGSCNSTKSTPCLSADIFGDWREEVLEYSTTDNATLNIYTTTETTKMRIPTLMHDNIYRLSVAAEQCCYNQPPHLGYYLPDFVKSEMECLTANQEQTVVLGDSIETITMRWVNCGSAAFSMAYKDGATKITSPGGIGLTQTKDNDLSTLTLTGKPTEAGLYEVILKTMSDFSGESITDTLKINVIGTDYLVGDANTDGEVDVADITAIASYILGGNPQPFNRRAADADGDNDITVADITAVAKIIMGN
ncbi:MAG: dockerin type I domain-containing protein [Prevotellaceae bacterium]|nr:dockerin type I domain-containing protein [Prevotellaceae bacterium]